MELTIADLKPFLPGLEAALDDEAVSEVMLNAPGKVFIERAGRMAALDAQALTAEAVARAAVQIARPLGKDPNTEPIIDARLADGSRVAICGPPAAPTAAITIRRFGGRAFTVKELTESGALPAAVVEEAAAVLRREHNVLISGGTGSGKTTLLNALVSLLPAEGRVISIEDTLELRLRRANCLRFEARGLGDRGVTIRDLVRHALRHRPDHIVAGEVRGAEAADLLQAFNTGHGAVWRPCTRTTPPRRCRVLRPAPCRRATRCRGRSFAAGWSMASRPSSTRPGRPKGSAASSRWSASATTTQARTAGSSNRSGRRRQRGRRALERSHRRRSGHRDPHRSGDIGGGERDESPASLSDR